MNGPQTQAEAVRDIERDLLFLWDNYRVQPTFAAMSLGNVRTFRGLIMRDDVNRLLAELDAQGAPDSVMIATTPTHCWVIEGSDNG